VKQLEVQQEQHLALLLVMFRVVMLVIGLEGFLFLYLLMAKRSVSRGRSSYRTPPNNKKHKVIGSARGSTVGSARSRSTVRSRASVSSAGGAKSGATTRTVVSFKKKSSGGAKVQKKPKVVKVSKAFKKKVTAALSEKKNTGYLEQSAFIFADNIVTNEQFSFYVGPGPAFVGCFSPIRVLDAASVLWNNKVAALDPSAVANMYDNKGTKITVLRQWMDVQVKNNTLRKKHLTVRVFTGRTKADYDLNPLAEWSAALLADSLGGSAVGNEIMAPLNQVATTVAYVGLSPKNTKRMRDKFKWTENVYILEPGQDFEASVEGPAMTYDYSNYWNADVVAAIPENVKPTSWVMFTIYNDIVQDSAGLVGRITDVATVAEGLLIATKACYRLEKPDVVGFSPVVAPAIGVEQPLNLAVSPYNYKTYSMGAYGPPIRVDEQNPVAVVFD